MGFFINNNNNGATELVDKSNNPGIIDLDISKVKKAEPLPVGIIVMFTGDSNNINSDWAFCDGTNGTPDLRGRFIQATTNTARIGVQGGYKDAEVAIHDHSGGYSTSEYKNHVHSVDYSKVGSSSKAGHTHTVAAASKTRARIESFVTSDGVTYYNHNSISVPTGYASSGNHTHSITVPACNTSTHPAHKHTISCSTAGVSGINKNLPPYYKLAYIMKVK